VNVAYWKNKLMNHGNSNKKIQIVGKLLKSFKGYHGRGRIVKERDFSMECSAICPQDFIPVMPKMEPVYSRKK
jgi:hypothetical protein